MVRRALTNAEANRQTSYAITLVRQGKPTSALRVALNGVTKGHRDARPTAVLAQLGWGAVAVGGVEELIELTDLHTYLPQALAEILLGTPAFKDKDVLCPALERLAHVLRRSDWSGDAQSGTKYVLDVVTPVVEHMERLDPMHRGRRTRPTQATLYSEPWHFELAKDFLCEVMALTGATNGTEPGGDEDYSVRAVIDSFEDVDRTYGRGGQDARRKQLLGARMRTCFLGLLKEWLRELNRFRMVANPRAVLRPNFRALDSEAWAHWTAFVKQLADLTERQRVLAIDGCGLDFGEFSLAPPDQPSRGRDTTPRRERRERNPPPPPRKRGLSPARQRSGPRCPRKRRGAAGAARARGRRRAPPCPPTAAC